MIISGIQIWYCRRHMTLEWIVVVSPCSGEKSTAIREALIFMLVQTLFACWLLTSPTAPVAMEEQFWEGQMF